MAAPTGSRTLRASTSQMRCKTTMLRQNLFVYIMMSSGLSTNTEHWQVVEFIAPSLPILVDSAVDAHATRAPAPFYSKGRLVYGTTCVRKSMTEWSFASGDSMMRLRGDRTQCGRRGRGGRERRERERERSDIHGSIRRQKRMYRDIPPFPSQMMEN